jgi:hypothetical protein
MTTAATPPMPKPAPAQYFPIDSALAWFLITDRIKLLAYRIPDPANKAKKNPNQFTT